MPHITRHLKMSQMPVTFREIYEQLGPEVRHLWDDAVMPGGANVVSELEYDEAINVVRPELMRQYSKFYAENCIDALLLPTTPTFAPLISSAAEIDIGGKLVHYRAIGKNVIASSCAGLPGLSVPIGLSADGLPIGLEIEGQRGSDNNLLEIATMASKIIGKVPAPPLVD
jgi:indoleacetamide hydrolase